MNGNPNDFGWRSANVAPFDGLYICPICACVVSMDNSGLEKHENWHVHYAI